MKLERGIFKEHGAEDRNKGEDNFIPENLEPGGSTDEAMLVQALRNCLGAEVQVEGIGKKGEGPPDVAVNERIAVEVVAPQNEPNSVDGGKVQKAIRKKVNHLTWAWRKESDSTGQRLRGFRECWIAVTLPMFMTWMDGAYPMNDVLRARMKNNQDQLREWIEEGTKGKSLTNPPITRVLILMRNPMGHCPLYAYTTKAFSAENSAKFEAFANSPGDDAVVPKALEWKGVRITSKEIDTGGAIYQSNEARIVVG